MALQWNWISRFRLFCCLPLLDRFFGNRHYKVLHHFARWWNVSMNWRNVFAQTYNVCSLYFSHTNQSTLRNTSSHHTKYLVCSSFLAFILVQTKRNANANAPGFRFSARPFVLVLFSFVATFRSLLFSKDMMCLRHVAIFIVCVCCYDSMRKFDAYEKWMIETRASKRK